MDKEDLIDYAWAAAYVLFFLGLVAAYAYAVLW